MAVAEKVTVELELKDGQYQSRIRQNERVFAQAMDKTGDAAELAERRVRNASDVISTSLKAAAGTLAAGFGAQAVVNLADSYTRFTNQLKVAGLEGQSLAKTQENLFAIAQKYGTELESLGTLYGRLSGSAKELGADNAELLKFTEAVSAAVKIQGGNASDANGALLQLSQALGGGTVRAEEFNSVMEGARPIVQAVANNLAGYGGSVQKLKLDVDAGRVSSQAFFDALIKAFPQLEAQAAKATLTISASLQTLNNALGQYIGQTDASLSATQRLSGGIKLLADNLNTVVPAIAALAGLFGTRYAAGIITASLAQDGFITKSRQAVAATIADERAKTLAVATGTRARTAAYTAESIALRAQVDTGRNASGQFVSRAKSAEALAVANRNLAASIGPATVATIRNTGAVQAATVGARALGSGLVALAGGPLGLAAIAIFGVVTALIALNNKYGEAAVAARELASSTDASDKALAEYEKASIEAANASGKGAKAARDHAAAMREEAQAAVVAARALAAKRVSEAQTRLEAASAAFSEATSGRPTEEGAAVGQLAFAAGAARERDLAQERAGAAVREQIRQEQEFARISAGINLGGVNNNAGGGDAAASSRQGGESSRANDAADKLDRLRSDLARIQDAQLTDAERAAKELAETIATINAAVEGNIITPEIGAALNRGASTQDIIAPDPIELEPLGNEAMEIGQSIREGFLADQAAFQEKGAAAGQAFTDILLSGNVWEALGYKFADAAANNLQTLLSQVFTAVFANQGQGASILNGIGTVLGFGGGRANGGPVRAGWSYDVGENGREKFVAPSNGYILPNMNTVAQRASSVTRVEVRQTFDLMGVTGDAAIYSNVSQMIKQGQAETLAIANRAAPGAQRQRALLKD